MLGVIEAIIRVSPNFDERDQTQDLSPPTAPERWLDHLLSLAGIYAELSV